MQLPRHFGHCRISLRDILQIQRLSDRFQQPGSLGACAMPFDAIRWRISPTGGHLWRYLSLTTCGTWLPVSRSPRSVCLLWPAYGEATGRYRSSADGFRDRFRDNAHIQVQRQHPHGSVVVVHHFHGFRHDLGLRSSRNRLLTRAAQKPVPVLTATYRAATVRERSPEHLFPQPARRFPGTSGHAA